MTNFAIRVYTGLLPEGIDITKNVKIVRDNLSFELRKSYAQMMSLELVEGKYRVNAVEFANAFNLRAHGTTTISRQTALKWIKGKGIPEPGHLYVLREWLTVDLNQIFGG